MKIKNFKHLNFIMAMAFCLFVFGPMGIVFAEEPPAEEEVGEIVEGDDPDPGDSEEDQEESAFQNPTQVQRAINIAEAYAAKPDPDLEKAQENLDNAQGDLDKAQAALDALDPDDPENINAIAELEAEIEGLKSELGSAQEDFDNRLAEIAGEEVTPESIEQMRAEGMGWGEICHALGLHPSISGMKHTKMYQNKTGWKKGFNHEGENSDIEIEKATARNFKSGFSKGHGVSADKGNSGKSSEKGAKGKENSGNKNGNNKGGKKK